MPENEVKKLKLNEAASTLWGIYKDGKDIGVRTLIGVKQEN